MKTIKTKLSTPILFCFTVAITMLYVSLIFNQNIWTDEAFTIQLVNSLSPIDIIKGTSSDVHPPLYYLITYVFVAFFGTSIQVYKVVSIIPMLLTMLLSIFYIKPWFGAKASALFILFLNAIPCVMEYSVQIRMYSWTIFFITLAVLSAYGYYRSQAFKHLVALTISAVCACYTHNFAMISAVFIYAILGIALIIKCKKISAKWLLSGLFVSAFYIPWLLVLYKQTNDRIGNYWISNIDKDTILGYFSDLFGSRIPYSTAMFVLLWIISIILLIFRVRKEKHTSLFALSLFAIPVLTATVGVLVSVLITPFFIARYLLPCMGLLALGFAIAFCKEKILTYSFLCAFLICMLGNSYYTNYQNEYCNSSTAELLAYMEDNLGPNDVITYNYELFDFIYECYFDTEQLVFLNDLDFSADYDNIWYFDSCTTPWLNNSTLVEHGLTKEYIATLGIEQNDFILYRIYK